MSWTVYNELLVVNQMLETSWKQVVSVCHKGNRKSVIGDRKDWPKAKSDDFRLTTHCRL